MAGFFKKLGASVKSLGKMIAIKNVTKVATGQWGDIAQEAATRIIKPYMAGGGVPNAAPKNAGANAFVAASVAGVRTLAKQTTAGDEAGKLGADLTDATIKQWFEKHKTKFMIGGVIVIALVAFKDKIFGKKTTNRRRY